MVVLEQIWMNIFSETDWTFPILQPPTGCILMVNEDHFHIGDRSVKVGIFLRGT